MVVGPQKTQVNPTKGVPTSCLVLLKAQSARSISSPLCVWEQRKWVRLEPGDVALVNPTALVQLMDEDTQLII